jgi:hypothetical protein
MPIENESINFIYRLSENLKEDKIVNRKGEELNPIVRLFLWITGGGKKSEFVEAYKALSEKSCELNSLGKFKNKEEAIKIFFMIIKTQEIANSIIKNNIKFRGSVQKSQDTLRPLFKSLISNNIELFEHKIEILKKLKEIGVLSAEECQEYLQTADDSSELEASATEFGQAFEADDEEEFAEQILALKKPMPFDSSASEQPTATVRETVQDARVAVGNEEILDAAAEVGDSLGKQVSTLSENMRDFLQAIRDENTHYPSVGAFLDTYSIDFVDDSQTLRAVLLRDGETVAHFKQRYCEFRCEKFIGELKDSGIKAKQKFAEELLHFQDLGEAHKILNQHIDNLKQRALKAAAGREPAINFVLAESKSSVEGYLGEIKKLVGDALQATDREDPFGNYQKCISDIDTKLEMIAVSVNEQLKGYNIPELDLSKVNAEDYEEIETRVTGELAKLEKFIEKKQQQAVPQRIEELFSEIAAGKMKPDEIPFEIGIPSYYVELAQLFAALDNSKIQ